MNERRERSRPCAWCGRPIAELGRGRRRTYCGQACRQRAYEERNRVRLAGLAPSSVVLTEHEAEALAERAYLVRCAAEDVATAVTEGADRPEIERLAAELLALAREAERLR